MDSELKAKLLKTPGCTECTINFAENATRLCKNDNQCKLRVVDTIIRFAKDNISEKEFVAQLKNTLGTRIVKKSAKVKARRKKK